MSRSRSLPGELVMMRVLSVASTGILRVFGNSPITPQAQAGTRLLTSSGEAQVLTEEWDDMILESVGDRTGVRAGVDLKTVCHSVAIEDVVQLRGIKPQSILIAHVYRDGAVFLEISDVLIDKSQRRVGREFRYYLRLGNAVPGWEVEVERRVLWIGRPSRCCRILGGREAG